MTRRNQETLVAQLQREHELASVRNTSVRKYSLEYHAVCSNFDMISVLSTFLFLGM